MENKEKFPRGFPGELLDRMCIARDGKNTPEALFDLVNSLDGDGCGNVTQDPATDVRRLREDAVKGCDGRSLLSGKTENGFAVTRFRLTSDDTE